MPSTADAPLPRDQRRRRTESAILHAAKTQFADAGFERTTIRTVATQAGIDPALVMQYYGSKEKLFEASTNWDVDCMGLAGTSVDDLPGAVVREILTTFEDPATAEAAIALLRSAFTHPGAAELLHNDVLSGWQTAVSGVIGGDEAELRSGVAGACVIGLAIARYLLQVPAVADATPEDLQRVMGRAIRAVVAD